MTVQSVPTGAGVASAVIIGSGGPPEGATWTGTWTTYQLSATPHESFAFSSFSCDYVKTTPNGTRFGTRSYGSNPTTSDPGPYWDMEAPCAYSITYENGDHYSVSITECRAIFTDVRRKIKVVVSVSPSSAQEDGCTASVDGESESEKIGVSGETAEFEISASQGPGWKFLKWAGEVDSPKSRSQTISLKFYAQDYTENIVAKFIRDSGKILCNDSGKILFGSSGSVLYEG